MDFPFPIGAAPFANRMKPPIEISIPEEKLLNVPKSYRYPPIDPETFVPDNYRPVPQQQKPSTEPTTVPIVNPTIFAPARHRDLQAELKVFRPTVLLRAKKPAPAPIEHEISEPSTVDRENASSPSHVEVGKKRFTAAPLVSYDDEDDDDMPIQKKPRISINLAPAKKDDDYEAFKKELGDLI